MIKEDNDIFAAFGFLCLSAASLNGIFNYNTKTWSPTGMHMVYFFHGIIGFLKSQRRYFGLNVNRYFNITHPAAKFLGIACLMSDLWDRDIEPDPYVEPSVVTLPRIHLVSGFLPFLLNLFNKEKKFLVSVAILFNIISLWRYCRYKKNTWAWLTFNFALFTYFIAPIHDAIKCECLFATHAMVPIGLALTEVCATRVIQNTPDPATLK